MVKLNTQENKKANVELNNDLFPELEILDPTEIAKRLSAQGMIEAQKRNVGEGGAEKKREIKRNSAKTIDGWNDVPQPDGYTGEKYLTLSDGCKIRVKKEHVENNETPKPVLVDLLPKTQNDFLAKIGSKEEKEIPMLRANIKGKLGENDKEKSQKLGELESKKTELQQRINEFSEGSEYQKIKEQGEEYREKLRKFEKQELSLTNDEIAALNAQIKNYNTKAEELNKKLMELETEIKTYNENGEKIITEINEQSNVNNNKNNELNKYISDINNTAGRKLKEFLNSSGFKKFWEDNNNTPTNEEIETYVKDFISSTGGGDVQEYLTALSPDIISFLIQGKQNINYGENPNINYKDGNLKINGNKKEKLNDLQTTGVDSSKRVEHERPELDYSELQKQQFTKVDKNEGDIQALIGKIQFPKGKGLNWPDAHEARRSDDYIIIKSKGIGTKNVSTLDWVYVYDRINKYQNLYHTKKFDYNDEKNEDNEGRKIFEPNRKDYKTETYKNYYPNTIGKLQEKYKDPKKDQQGNKYVIVEAIDHYDVMHDKLIDLTPEQKYAGILQMDTKNYISSQNEFYQEKAKSLYGKNWNETEALKIFKEPVTPERQIMLQAGQFFMGTKICEDNIKILEEAGKTIENQNILNLKKNYEEYQKKSETLARTITEPNLEMKKITDLAKDLNDLKKTIEDQSKGTIIIGKKKTTLKKLLNLKPFSAVHDLDGRYGAGTYLNKVHEQYIHEYIIPVKETKTEFTVETPKLSLQTNEKLPFEPFSFEVPQLPELEQIKTPAYEEGKFQDQKMYLHNTPSLKLEGGFEKSTNDWLDEITNLRNEVWRKIRAKGFKRLGANPLADRTIKLEDNGLLAEEAVGVNDVEGITNLRKIFKALDYQEKNLKVLFTSLKQGVKTFDELKEAAPGVYKLLKANIDAENHESGDSYDLGKMTEEEAREKALAKAKRDFATEDESKLFKREIRSEDGGTLRILYTSSGGGVARDALRAQYEVANNLSTDANLGVVKEQYYTQRLVLLLQQLETKSLKEIMRQNYTPKLKEEDRESELKPFKEGEGYNKLIKDSVAHLEDPEDKAAEKIARFEAIKKRIPQDRPSYRKISFLIGDIDLNATIDNADGKSAYKGQELSVLLDQMANYFTLKEGQEGEKRVIENIAKFIRQQDKTLKEDDLPLTDIEGFLNWLKGDYYRLLVVQKSLYHTGYDPRYILQYGDEAGAKALEDELVAVEKKKEIIGEIYEELLKEKEKVGKSIILNVRKELEAKAKEGTTAEEFYAFENHLRELGFIDPKTGGWREFDQMDDDRQRYIFGKTAAVIANSLFRGGKPILSPDGKTVNKDFFSIGIGGVVANLDNILEGLHVNGDVVMTNGSPSVNLGLGRSTGDIDLGKGRRIRGDAFAGASVGLESPKTIKDILAAGGAVTAGKDLNKTLDNLGVEEKHALEATVGYSFPGVLSAGVNYVRDFAAGVEEKRTGVEQRFGDLMDQVLDPIFNAGQLSELLNSTPGEENAARSTLIDALSQAFNDTKPEHTQKAADNIINFLRTYGEKAIAGDNSAEKWEFVKHNLKRYFILNGRNQDNATLVDKGWHTSGAQIGLSWIIGSFTPRTLSLGYTQSRYLNLHYQDTAEAVAEDYMNNAAMIGYEDMAEIPTENYIAYINRRLEATHTYKLPDKLKLSVSGDYINVPRKLANANGGILSIEFAEDMKGEVKGNREGDLNLQSPEFIENQAVMQIPISAMMRFKETKTNEGVKNVLRFGEGANYEGGKKELYGSGTEQPREVKTTTEIVEKPLSITEKLEFDNQRLKGLHLYEAQENQEYLMLLGYIDQMTNKTGLYNKFKETPNKETLLAIIQSTVDEKQADKLVKNLDQKVRKQVKNWLNTYRPNIQAIIDTLNSSEISDTDKQKIIDRMQQAFARIPRSLNTGEEVKTEVKKHRNIPKELKDLGFEELLENLPKTIQRTVDPSLIGYSAFYRQGTIQGLGATSLGGTSVLNERIGEGIIVEKELLPGSDAYQKAQDILFGEYQDKNGKVMGLKSEKDVQRRIEIASKISDLIKRHTNKSVTIPDDPEKPGENLCRILKGEKFDIADNGTVTLNPEGKNSLQVATYIYLLGECANESVGFRIEGLTTTVSEEITTTEEGGIKPGKRYLSSYTRQTENHIEEAVRSLNVTVGLGKTEPAYGDTEQVREGDEGSGSGSDNREGDSGSGSGSGTGSSEAGGTDGR